MTLTWGLVMWHWRHQVCAHMSKIPFSCYCHGTMFEVLNVTSCNMSRMLVAWRCSCLAKHSGSVNGVTADRSGALMVDRLALFAVRASSILFTLQFSVPVCRNQTVACYWCWYRMVLILHGAGTAVLRWRRTLLLTARCPRQWHDQWITSIKMETGEQCDDPVPSSPSHPPSNIIRHHFNHALVV